MNVCAVVFARAPSKGKTRLASQVGRSLATQLARAFLEDTFSTLGRARCAHVVLSTPDPDEDWSFLPGLEIWRQEGACLGRRLEGAARRALRSYPRAVLLGADAPGMTVDALETVVEALGVHDVVLAPADDGGFWALGARRAWEGHLDGVAWSHAETGGQTTEAFQRGGFDVGEGPMGWDIDDARGLGRLMERGSLLGMPATARVLDTGEARASLSQALRGR